MRKNTQSVLEAFKNYTKKGERGDSISTDGTTIYSYDTPIATHSITDPGSVNLLRRKFSRTNTRQQNAIAVSFKVTLWERLP